MTITEYAPSQDDILDYINSSIQQLRETGAEAKTIVVGPQAYEVMRKAMAERFRRSEGAFETYQYLPIVVDPFRTDTVTVLPAASACADGVRAVRLD